MPKNANNYECSICEFKCSKLSNLNAHFLTRKHKLRIDLNEKNSEEMATYYCKNCNKGYKAKNSLWYHEKKCTSVDTEENKKIISIIKNDLDNPINASLLLEVVKQTQEFKNLLIEQNNKIIELANQNTMIQNNITNNTTNHHNSFNLNLFLNETCKDALNLMDFVNSLQLKLTDFEATGRLGYIEGISKIIVNGLKKMDVHKRPIHCTDIKRETMYVKDQNIWEKENDEKSKLSKAVQIIANKNFQQMKEWQKQHPECLVNNTSQNEHFIQIMLAVLGGQTEEEEEKNREKILRNIAKEVVINKSNLLS